MDKNKLQVLRDIGYRIQPCCANCNNGLFLNDRSDFGLCLLHHYDHLKHGTTRELSIHRVGCCPQHERDLALDGELGGFVEFVKDKTS